MEIADALGSSTAPLTWHDFLERMRQPSASDFVKAIKSFIVSFSNNAPDPEKDSAAVQQFLTKMEAAFRAHPLWAGCSEEELESAGEGLEKYVMTKLFTRVFASLPDDARVDESLYEKMALIQQFIRPENLDIKPKLQNETSWLLAQKELQKINMYKAPRDKLVCILNCCKVINNILLNASIASNESPPGADEFLPVLIYVTIKANPPQLHSNLLYIQRYRHNCRLAGEAAYLFTNMLSAESFVSNIDAKSLSISETEFEQNMESARSLLSGLSADLGGQIPKAESMEFISQTFKDPAMEQLSSQSSESRHRDQLAMEKTESTSDLENKGAAMILEDDKGSHVFRDYPYLYARVGDLTISDVEDLLDNYKQLVFKYVCLAKGKGASILPTASDISQAQMHRRARSIGTEISGKKLASILPTASDISQAQMHRRARSIGTEISGKKLEDGGVLDISEAQMQGDAVTAKESDGSIGAEMSDKSPTDDSLAKTSVSDVETFESNSAPQDITSRGEVHDEVS